MGEWLAPFKGRNTSLGTELNFLWRHENIYIMDNHLAALWCWMQHVKPKAPVPFLCHIDEHYDCCEIPGPRIPVEKLSLIDYLSIKQKSPMGDFPVFRWDNYISPFLDRFHLKSKNGDAVCFLTHRSGELPEKYAERVNELEISYLTEFDWEVDARKWIVNIDLDYFVCSAGHDENRTHYRLFSNEVLACFLQNLRGAMDKNIVAALTVAMSPECSGGWEFAEALLNDMCQGLCVPFKLPH